MLKTAKTPVSVLTALMDEYQLTPYSLSKAINLSNSAVLQIVKGKNKITVPTALRLSKFFDKPAAFWLDIQREADLNEAAKDKELSAILKGITKAKKPAKKSKAPAKAKPAKQAKPLKKTTLKDKRKKAAKVPGSKTASRKAKKS